MNTRLRAFVSGMAGAVVAFGLAELVHGLYELVPSVFVAVAQLVIGLTPGGAVTTAIETLGTADIPVFISFLMVASLVVAGLLALLALRSPIVALLGVGVLAAVAIAAAITEPSASPVPTVLTILAALGLGSAVTGFLLRASELQAPSKQEGESAPQGGVQGGGQGRSREAHSTDGIAIARRNFLVLSGGAALAGLTLGGIGRGLSGTDASAANSPAPLNLPGSSGEGASGSVTNETLPAPPPEASIDAPGMPPLMTPAAEFYLIDTVLSEPRINRDNWTLNIMGEVDNPIEISYDDLLSMSTREADVTLSCISNEVGGGLVSNGRWTGVMLSDVLAEAGVSSDKISSASEQLVGRSVDGWESGFPTEIALDGREALVAFGLNGEELPTKHGYPVRLVVPGLYGYVSATKWLTEIELTDWAYEAYWVQRGWSKEGPILTQSRIDTISNDDRLDAGTVQVGGVAWAPHRGIERVEVSTDDGESWNDATLAAQLDIDAWRLWIYDWEAEPGEHTVKVRATDGNGETQTEGETAPHPSGATGYHTVNVTVE